MNKKPAPAKGQTTLEYVAFQNLYSEPTFSINRQRNFITLGEDNLLPEYTVSLLDKSPDHAAVIIGTIMFAQGAGLVPPENNPKAEAMFQNGEPSVTAPNNLNEIQQKLISDLVVHGAALLNIRWRKDRTGIADVHWVDVRTMRIDSEGNGYWISTNWSDIRKNPPELFPAFTTEEGGSQLLYVKMPSARPFPYGMPAYWSARQAIELQYELMTFNLNRTKNNFFVSSIISFEDLPLDEKQKENHKKIKEFFTGSKGKNVGGALTLYGSGVKVDSFDSGSGPKDFIQMQETADQRIRAAHRVTGRGDLFGLGRGDGATFSSADDLLNEFETYSKMCVRPIQNVILGVWNMIGEINSIGHVWEIDPFILFEDDAIKTAEEGNNGPSASSPAIDAPAVDASIPAASTVAETALNGAQIDALVNIVAQVASGALSKATALPLIRAAFPSIPLDVVQAMIAGTDAAVPPTNPLQ